MHLDISFFYKGMLNIVQPFLSLQFQFPLFSFPIQMCLQGSSKKTKYSKDGSLS